MIERSKKIFRTYPLAEASFEDIEKMLFENTFKNFVDPEFPPNDESLQKGSNKNKIDTVVHWRRPQDFMYIDPKQEDHKEIRVFHK